MYSHIKEVTLSKTGFPDVVCREMFDDATGLVDVQIRGGKNNHEQSGYSWHTLKNQGLETYHKWLSNPPNDVLVKVKNG